MSILCENEDNLSSTPFNDTDEPRVQQHIIGFDLAEQGMDTRAIDPYRQGVEIRTAKHRFAGMQPKIGTDSPCHYAKVVTYGQTLSFTQFQNDVKFTDKIGVFDTVGYMNNPIAYEPIIFNDGPQENIEAQMEPLTIPYRMSNMSDSGPYIQRAFHGNIEDGNESVHLGKGNHRIEQFISYKDSAVKDFFLDEGELNIGLGNSIDSIHVDGFVSFAERVVLPYNDLEDEEIVKQIQTTDSDMISALKALDYDLSEDIRGSFVRKSATAGISCYGPQAARYGTDSIAFANLVRGS